MPREFIWQNTAAADCRHYIDLLCQKRLHDAKVLEDRLLVSDITYDPGIADQSTRPYVTVNPTRLVALLRGEEILEIPLDARIRFKPDARHYVSNDVDAAIFHPDITEAYLQNIRRMIGEGIPIYAIGMPDEKELLEKYGFRLIDTKMHSGSNLDIAREAYGPTETITSQAAPAPVSETEVSTSEQETHTETVSLITGNGSTPYFVKRLLRDQHLLWSGTSYHPSGPWTSYFADTSRLTALGIHPA